MGRTVRKIDGELAYLQANYANMRKEEEDSKAKIQAMIRDQNRAIRARFIERVQKLLDGGYYKSDVSRALGVSRPTLDAWLRDWGLYEVPSPEVAREASLIDAKNHSYKVADFAFPRTYFEWTEKSSGLTGEGWIEWSELGEQWRITYDSNDRVAPTAAWPTDPRWATLVAAVEAARPADAVHVEDDAAGWGDS